MRCEVCGAELVAVETDLPFKIREPGIVILKGVPVLQCPRCHSISWRITCSPASTQFCGAWTS